MAPPNRYPNPLQQLGVLAAEARRARVPFGEFWQRAMRPDAPMALVSSPRAPEGAVLWPSDRDARVAWREALLDEDVRAAWERAYTGAPPSRGELAVQALMGALHEDAGEPLLVAA